MPEQTPIQKKILVVEDDRFLSQVLKSRFEKEGVSVLQAFDGGQGIELARKDGVSMILLDLIMPKVSGFEMLEQMSADPRISSIPVVVISNLGQDSDIQKAKQLGVIDYYVKVQTSIDDLVDKIRGMILGA